MGPNENRYVRPIVTEPTTSPLKIVFIVHYFPPVNSSGARRVEALTKYLSALGHRVTVITTRKTSADGVFSEISASNIDVIELDRLGRDAGSVETRHRHEPMFGGTPSFKRRIATLVMRICGQLPDPRLPFALSFGAPWLSERAISRLRQADVLIVSTPPWPVLLAGAIVSRKYRIPCVMDYRDQFSAYHAMPGSRPAKWLEKVVDRWLVRRAAQVVTISEPMARYYRAFAHNVTTIMNGYDKEVLDAVRSERAAPRPKAITVRFMGSVAPNSVPHNFLKALVGLREARPERFSQLSIEFYGTAKLVEDALRDAYPSIRNAFSFHPFVPYRQSLKLILEADFLLFSETSSKASLSAQGMYSTKLFEYIGSGRPVIADISTDTLAGSLLVQAGSQHVVGDTVQIFTDALRSEKFYSRQPDQISPIATKLSRKEQAAQYASLLGEVAKQQSHESESETAALAARARREYRICSNCIMDTTDSNITFDEKGVCDYCNNYYNNILPNWHTDERGQKQILRVVDRIKRDGRGRQYDCLIGISGGVDSSYMTYMAKTRFGLRPLVLHIDAGWNSQEAVNNIERLVDGLGLDLHTEVIDWQEMKDLQLAFFKAQVPHLDAPQDHAFTGAVYNYAAKHGFKYILNGGNYSTECVREPLEWAYHASDLRQLKDIHRRFGTRPLKTFPFAGILRYRLYYRFMKGVRVIRLLNYIPYVKEKAMQELVDRFGWQRYSHKHYESRFTRFYEGYWLPTKFGYEKRRAHFSSLILTGQMTRAEALERMTKPAYDEDTIAEDFEYIATKLDISVAELRALLHGPNKTYRDYKSAMPIMNLGAQVMRALGIQRAIIR